MAEFFKPRVKETTTTTGTGSLQLLGAPTGYQTFLNAFGNGARCYYFVFLGASFEYGLGTINSSSQLARTLVINSTSGGAVVNFGAGTKQVYCAIIPETLVNNGITALTQAAGTPSVKNARVFSVTNGSSQSITNFTNGVDGQELTLVFTDSNTTIVHGSTIRLSGGSNFGGTSNDTMRLVQLSGIWYEMSRSVNT